MIEHNFPAVCVLAAATIIFAVMLLTLGREATGRLLAGPGAMGFAAVGLFVFVGILHLFAGGSQDWTADLLKVLVGVLTGVGASTVGRQEVAQVQQTAIGTQIDQAGRDIIKRMEGNISTLRDSVVQQFQTIQQQLAVDARETRPGLQLTQQISAADNSPDFIERMRDLRKGFPEGSTEWVPQFINECLSNEEIQRQLREHFAKFQASGWVVRSWKYQEPRHLNGVVVNVDLVAKDVDRQARGPSSAL